MAKNSKKMLTDLLEQALADHAAGKIEQSINGFKTVLHNDARNVIALYMLGAICSENGQLQVALQYLNHAISINNQFAPSYLARSIVSSKLGNYKSAFIDTQTALKLDPELESAKKNYETLKVLAEQQAGLNSPGPAPLQIHAGKPVARGIVELIEQSGRVVTAQQKEQLIQNFQDYLRNPDQNTAHLALFSIAVLHHDLGRNIDAEAYFRQALRLKDDFFICHLNLGLLLERINRATEAIEQWELACNNPNINKAEARDDKLKIMTNLGRLLEILNEYERAEAALLEALKLDPDNGPVLHHWLHLRQKQCRWPVAHGLNRTETELLACASPIAMLGLSNDPAAQLIAGRHFVETKVENHPRMVPFRHKYKHERLKIGDLVHAVGGMSDEQVAHLISSLEIDIIVDLQGLTSGARPNIVARGPAPVQIAYLGYPGPSALPYIDFVVADPFIMPPELCEHFTEKPLYLPGLFQVSDSKRHISPIPSRAHFGLKDEDFVFCAFNNNHKFTPEMFESWMRILRATPHGILWLLEDNQWSKANLLQAAFAHGVAPERLSFAGRIAPADYLARFAVADLFLDTMPYNAGTTANDALWAGLPLLTLSGNTYASRMAGSLLRSIGLETLITFNHRDYEETAIRLANNSHEINELREKIALAKQTQNLFNTQKFTREFEAALKEVLA